MKNAFLISLILVLLTLARPCAAADLTVSIGGTTKQFSTQELLNNPATVTISIPKDAAYGHAMSYQALPLAVLSRGFTLPQGYGLQAVATDGFTADLPAALVLRDPSNKRAVAYLAIEPPDHPWPKLAGKQQTAGPFYVVWLRPALDDIRPEQWPYGVVKISSAPAPQKRWPAMAVDALLPADAPELKGLALFATNCMVCHKINGAGDAEVGPDLNLPKSAVEYFQPKALHQYIRDPASLRAWKAMGMKGFSAEALSDDEIDLIIAYLKYMSQHKQPLK